MMSSIRFGMLLGVVVSTLSILGNLRRGDPHLVSLFPDLVGVALIVLAISFVTRRQRGRLDLQDLMWFGLRHTLAAAMVVAVLLAIFTLWWMPGTHTIAYAVFLGSLASVMGLGGCASLLAAGVSRGASSVRT